MAPNVNTKLNAMFVIDVSLKIVDLELKKEVTFFFKIQKWHCKLMLELEPWLPSPTLPFYLTIIAYLPLQI